MDFASKVGRSGTRWIAKSGERNINFSLFIGGLALGVLGAFFLDPDEGRRRRALLRDKGISWRNDFSWNSARYGRYIRNMVAALPYRFSSVFVSEPPADDLTMVNRVRSEVGRYIRHPGSLDVISRNGTITLRGPILTDEVRRLIRNVRRVPGVRGVINELEVHDSPEHISGLQGAGKQYLNQ